MPSSKRSDTPSSGATERAGLDARVQERLGAELRRHYGDIVEEAVPDRFLALLDRLEAGEADAENGGAPPVRQS